MCADPSSSGHAEALELWEQGFQHQQGGDLAAAESFYQRSIQLHPTAEAWTFLGWVCSWRGDPRTAIEHCQRAIEVDPGYGNPYNDIGAYLIELGQPEQAIPWLLKATEAPRYEARFYPWANLGRAYERLGRRKDAIEHYRKALEHEPRYSPAAHALDRLLARRNGQVKLPTT